MKKACPIQGVVSGMLGPLSIYWKIFFISGQFIIREIKLRIGIDLGLRQYYSIKEEMLK